MLLVLLIMTTKHSTSSLLESVFKIKEIKEITRVERDWTCLSQHVARCLSKDQMYQYSRSWIIRYICNANQNISYIVNWFFFKVAKECSVVTEKARFPSTSSFFVTVSSNWGFTKFISPHRYARIHDSTWTARPASICALRPEGLCQCKWALPLVPLE